MYSYGAALPCTTYGGFPSTISYGSGFGSVRAPTYSIAATAYSGGLVSFPAASYPQPTAVSQVPPPIPSLLLDEGTDKETSFILAIYGNFYSVFHIYSTFISRSNF